jgi:hypothetical protein
VRAVGALIRLAAMPGTNRLCAPLGLVAAVVALSGCGSSDVGGEIPQADAAQLNASLDAVNSAIASNDCATASAQADAFVQMVNDLPASAGTELKDALRNAGENLEGLVADQCSTTGSTSTKTTSSSSSEPTTSSTSSSTTSSSTTSTSTDTTTTTSTTSTTETKPPGGGNQGGNGGGGGGDGGTGGGTGGTGG